MFEKGNVRVFASFVCKGGVFKLTTTYLAMIQCLYFVSFRSACLNKTSHMPIISYKVDVL